MTLALTNAKVFPGAGEETIPDGTVVIDGKAVSWVGPAADAPGADETVDCSGKTVTPGFIDAHAHLIYDEVTEPYTIELARPLERAAIDAALNAQKLLLWPDAGASENLDVMKLYKGQCRGRSGLPEAPAVGI